MLHCAIGLCSHHVYSVTHSSPARSDAAKHQEQINEAKLQFFINISHEIRTPMTLIISPLEKLLAEHSEKQPVYLMIYRNAQRILRLINQLMDIRKLDKGQMHLKFRETDIVGFINDLMQTFNYQAQKRISHSLSRKNCRMPTLSKYGLTSIISTKF